MNVIAHVARGRLIALVIDERNTITVFGTLEVFEVEPKKDYKAYSLNNGDQYVTKLESEQIFSKIIIVCPFWNYDYIPNKPYKICESKKYQSYVQG